MKYKIYILHGEERIIHDGYHTKTMVDNKLTSRAYSESFNSEEEAVDHIKENSHEFKGKELIIVPYVRVDYNGDIQ